MAGRVDITPETRVGELLEAYPQLEQTLIDFAPVFAKLKNPVLRRTVAKVTTLQRAAGVAGVDMKRLINALRAEVGEGPLEGETDARSHVEPEPPTWLEQSKVVETIDAGALLDSGQTPVAPVLRRARELGEDELLAIQTTFRPEPLADMARGQGFDVHIRPEGGGRFTTFLRRR